MKSKLLSVLVNKLQVIFFVVVAMLAQSYLGDTSSFFEQFWKFNFHNGEFNYKEKKPLYFFFFLCFKCLCAFLFAVL